MSPSNGNPNPVTDDPLDTAYPPELSQVESIDDEYPPAQYDPLVDSINPTLDSPIGNHMYCTVIMLFHYYLYCEVHSVNYINTVHYIAVAAVHYLLRKNCTVHYSNSTLHCNDGWHHRSKCFLLRLIIT
jgi:hypothetical protein